MSHHRMKSRSSKRRSAPVLYWMPGQGKELGRGFASLKRYAPAPAQRVTMARTGQLFHLFLDEVYVDTFLSPAVSNSFESQATEAHVQAVADAVRV